MAALLALHGDDPVEGGVFRGGGKKFLPPQVSMPLRDFFPLLHKRELPADSYIFLDVHEMALANSSKPLGNVYERVSLLRDRGYAFAPHAARGRPILSAGGWGNGRAFHSHGPALNALVSGIKHWFVRRPNASSATGVQVPSGLVHGEALPKGWEGALWQCTQRAGDLVWLPNRLEHATSNYDDEVVGLFHVINDLGESPLHAAAQAGDARAVRELLRAGSDGSQHLHMRTKRGATPLHYASGHGHVDAMRLLIAARANLTAAAKNGGHALHAAAAGGHAMAVELLLRHGADADARDAEGGREGTGRTPHELATSGLSSLDGRERIARVLLAAMSDAAAASIVHRDVATLSQPFVHEGYLLASASSGRRVFLHDLSELPRSEVFTSRNGIRVERLDATTVALAGTAIITLDVPPDSVHDAATSATSATSRGEATTPRTTSPTLAPAPTLAPTLPPSAVQIALQLPAGLFGGPAEERDTAMMRLLHEGIRLNSDGDFRSACALFEAAYALSVRPGLLVSAANMWLKLGHLATAVAMYRTVLADAGLGPLAPHEKEMASQKLAEAREQLQQQVEQRVEQRVLQQVQVEHKRAPSPPPAELPASCAAGSVTGRPGSWEEMY